MSLKKVILGAVSALALAACGTQATNSTSSTAAGNSSAKTEQTVKVGVVGTKHEQWDHLQKVLKEKENINLEIVEFTDYVQPNLSLEEGSTDINAFQHIIYLQKFNAEKGTKAKEIGYTVVSPIGAYSNKIKNLDELKDGDVVSIPNDVTNGARALRLLHRAGVIKLNDINNVTVTVADIESYNKKIEIKELDAAQTLKSLEDVTAAVINSNFIVEAGRSPKEESIFMEPIDELSKPYYNVIAAREDRANEEVFKTIVKYYQTDEVAEIIEKSFKGANVPVWKEAK